MKQVLCLGAGLVARPFVYYLSNHSYHVVVASRTKEKADQLIIGCENAEAVAFDIAEDDSLLDRLTSESDLVCSLLPYTFHVKAAKVAIRHQKPFCTTSYISNEMKGLDGEAREAGVLLLNECGVDPGIDHMSAMKIIDEVHEKEGKILSFTSFTGGLPAPEANDNPFGYKLSWSPRGVLLAGRNDAHFLKDGKQVTIPGPDLFDRCEEMDVPNMGTFEGYPNRDSLSYIDIYNIPETKTMLRGTLRNVGWCTTLKKIADLGLLNLEEQSFDGMSYRDLLRKLVDNGENLVQAVADACKVDRDDEIISRFKWLGLFDDRKIPAKVNTSLDALCHLFEEKLQYESGERDMIVMLHEFIVEYPNNSRKRITSTMVDYGIPHGDSSMSRTVALPVAIASKMILEDEVNLIGVHRPILPELYVPILKELENLGINLEENETEL